MLNIYFDNVLIDNDAYAELTNDYKLFNDSFYLGSTASNTFKIKILKSEVSNHPTNVKIEDDNTTFHLIVDKVEEEKGFFNYYLVDKMVDFNFGYDAKPLIDSKLELEEDCYLSDILGDMCLKANVELDYVLTNDIVVSWYDSRIQAREYLSFIAELEGGYACINEQGKLTIKQHKQASKKTISADEVSELIIGEKKNITRVVYDNGVVKYEFGDDTGNTLYLNQNNVFITDEVVVENIYNKIVGFEFYTLTVPNALIDSSIKAGDVITFADDTNEYPTIAQYSSSYGGGWVGSYDFNINTEKQEETQITGLYDSVLSIRTEIDRTNAELKITAEKSDEAIEKITAVEQTVDGVTTKIEEIDEIEERTTTIEENIDGLKVGISSIGGNNFIKNSVGYFNTNWENVFPGITDSEIKIKTVSKNCFFIGNGSMIQEIQVQNETYTISFNYKKLIGLSNVKVKINGHEIVLDSLDWKKENYTFEVRYNTIEIIVEGDTSNCCYLSDLMCNFGIIPQVWSSAPGESINGGVAIGETIEITSEKSNIKQVMDHDGNRVINTESGEIVAEYTDKGMKTQDIEATNGNIARLLIKDIGNQTIISRI